jgi:hypothetical protein
LMRVEQQHKPASRARPCQGGKPSQKQRMAATGFFNHLVLREIRRQGLELSYRPPVVLPAIPSSVSTLHLQLLPVLVAALTSTPFSGRWYLLVTSRSHPGTYSVCLSFCLLPACLCLILHYPSDLHIVRRLSPRTPLPCPLPPASDPAAYPTHSLLAS